MIDSGGHLWVMAKSREFNVIIERDSEGYFLASVPDLKGCHTQAKSLDTLMKRIREVIELCLEDEAVVRRKFRAKVDEAKRAAESLWRALRARRQVIVNPVNPINPANPVKISPIDSALRSAQKSGNLFLPCPICLFSTPR